MNIARPTRQREPDMIVPDEPANNPDIQNLEILTRVTNEYISEPYYRRSNH